MFKTKERDIDKANMKIEVLEWQLKLSIEMQGDANNERDSALGEARRLRKELRECKESNMIGDLGDVTPNYRDVVIEGNDIKKDRDELQNEVVRLRVLLQERRELEFGLGRDERKRLHDELEGSRSLLVKSQSYRVSNANEIKTLADKLHRLQTDYDELMGVFMGSIRERDTLRTDKRNLEKANKGLELDIEGMKEGYYIHCYDGTKGAF